MYHWFYHDAINSAYEGATQADKFIDIILPVLHVLLLNVLTVQAPTSSAQHTKVPSKFLEQIFPPWF
jgi:hypothetical protein